MKKGSALLIVLGMLAFMVISAVAFSAYMRYSRMPSSFLRRSSSSRLLVKAALAEAVDEIDAAIGNNPHPGIGQRQPRQTAGLAAAGAGGLNASALTRNHWKNRVYVGTNQLFEAEDTVSTLTLESLAYIPPPLVNEARYYSRRSAAGCWRKLGFDAGRYAFCAIDVSDFFDVNAIPADSARTSSAGSRISLAYLFENAAHTSPTGPSGTPKAWDDFIGDFIDRSDSSKVPLVSVADWNLAVNWKKPGGLQSQFCQYITENRTSFYGGIGEQGADADAIRNQVFVTDSWFPAAAPTYTTSAGGSISPRYDLSDPQYQPFTHGEIHSCDRSLYALVGAASLANRTALLQFKQSLSGLGLAALYDYLDEDDAPVSLAIPTTERVPMICAMTPSASGMLTVSAAPVGTPNQITPPTGNVDEPYTISHQVKYTVSGLQAAPVEVVVAYPFRHDDVINSSQYELGGCMAYFLSVDDGDVRLRTGSIADILHVGYQDSVNGGRRKNEQSGYAAVENAVLTVPFAPQDIQPSAFNGSDGADGAVKRFTLTPNGLIPPGGVVMLDVTYNGQDKFVANPNSQSGGGVPNPDHSAIDLAKGDKATAADGLWKPLTADGRLDARFAGNLLNTLNDPGFSKGLKVNLAVWVWVKNKITNKYVDMVPACVLDDVDLNGRNNDNLSKTFGQSYLGAAYPLMRFDMEASRAPLLSFKSAAVASGVIATAGASAALQVTPAAVMVCDPRYNHAPESWFVAPGAVTESTWLENNESGMRKAPNGGYRRDGDIFMDVSDQEYLQSVYELANLPRLTDFYQVGANWDDQGWYEPPDARNLTCFPASAQDTSNFKYVWRTYDPTSRYRVEGDNFDEAGFVNDGNGFKVNPFSNITNVIMAAFANTPHDWRVAGTNDEAFGAANIPVDAQYNRDYAWNGYSSGAKIQWSDLQDVASAFMEDMRRDADQIASKSKTWEDVWFDLGWHDDAKNDQNGKGEEWAKDILQGLPLSDTSGNGRIWNCDRKFLYGYWHDCFAIRQQLFLVFVRAEPAMMGGGAVNQTPPQLGARAVALVWRDPTTTDDDRKPHRTRILFYRQLD